MISYARKYLALSTPLYNVTHLVNSSAIQKKETDHMQ